MVPQIAIYALVFAAFAGIALAALGISRRLPALLITAGAVIMAAFGFAVSTIALA